MPIVTLDMVAGASKIIRLTVTDAASTDPVDLTAAALEFQLKPRPGDPDPPLIAKSVGAGILLQAQSGLTLGLADVFLLPADTTLLRGTYYWDVVVVLSGSRQYVVDPGSTIVIRPAVNQP